MQTVKLHGDCPSAQQWTDGMTATMATVGRVAQRARASPGETYRVQFMGCFGGYLGAELSIVSGRSSLHFFISNDI